MSTDLSDAGAPPTQSPFSRVPVDVANIIFGFCLSPAPTIDQLAAAGHGVFRLIEGLGKPFQFTLGAVCQNWRHIVWVDPQFWRFVQITITATTSPSYVDSVKECLERSKQLPLVIVVAFWQKSWSWKEQVNEDTAAPIVRPLISTLRVHARRWSLLAASLHIPFIEELQSIQATNLEAVLLTPPIRNNPIIQIRSRVSVLSPSTAPRGRLIAVTGFQSCAIAGQWKLLEHYIGECMAASECLFFLQSAPRLLSCSFRAMMPLSFDEILPNVINKSVECLQIGDYSRNLLPYLTCPSLRKVDLDLEYESPMPTILSFLERSRCLSKVTKFIFRRASASGMEYIELFESMPLIEDLAFSATQVEPIFFEQLGARDASGFLPNLRSLEASFHYQDTFPWSTFIKVTSRRSLRRIVISLFDMDAQSEECNSEGEVIYEASKSEVPGDWIGEEGLLVAREIVDAGVHFEVLYQHGKDLVKASIGQPV